MFSFTYLFFSSYIFDTFAENNEYIVTSTMIPFSFTMSCQTNIFKLKCPLYIVFGLKSSFDAETYNYWRWCLLHSIINIEYVGRTSTDCNATGCISNGVVVTKTIPRFKVRQTYLQMQQINQISCKSTHLFIQLRFACTFSSSFRSFLVRR